MCADGLVTSKTSHLSQATSQGDEPSRTMKKVTDTLKKELRLKQLGLSCDHPGKFLRSQWQGGSEISVWYLLYRWLVSCYFLATIAFNLYNMYRQDAPPRKAKWYFYMTYWGYMLCTVQAIIGAFLVTRSCCQQNYEAARKHGVEMPLYLRLYWLLHTTALDMSLTITSIFWVVIYNSAKHNLDFATVSNHVFNSVAMGLDLIVVAHPTRLLHVLWPFCFLMTYFLFSVVYFWMGGVQIYPVLDWYRPFRTASICGSALLYLLFVHLCTWALHLVRRHLSRTITRTSDKQDDVKTAFIKSSLV